MARPADETKIKRIANVIAAHPEGINASTIARTLGLPRSTVTRYLPKLESRGILLVENREGKLSIF
jgi:DNA-binding IclR family transcriptional regulator